MKKKLEHFLEADPEHKANWVLNISFIHSVGKRNREWIQENHVIVNEIGFHVDYRIKNDQKRAKRSLFASELYALLKPIAKPKTVQSKLRIKTNSKIQVRKLRKNPFVFNFINMERACLRNNQSFLHVHNRQKKEWNKRHLVKNKHVLLSHFSKD